MNPSRLVTVIVVLCVVLPTCFSVRSLRTVVSEEVEGQKKACVCSFAKTGSDPRLEVIKGVSGGTFGSSCQTVCKKKATTGEVLCGMAKARKGLVTPAKQPAYEVGNSLQDAPAHQDVPV